MDASTSTAPQRVTFGVELEILVPYLWCDQEDPAGDTDQRRVIRLSEDDLDPDQQAWSAQDMVREVLRTFLETHDVPVYEIGELQDGPPTKWSVGSDSTVRETKFTMYKFIGAAPRTSEMYRFAGLEIRSPALIAEAGSFEELKRVVSLLRQTFRLRLNETTGFHVHVGIGAQKLPPRAVRRLAQFLWCADGMLSQLHPPERMMNQFCPSIRHSSQLAQGKFDQWRQGEEQIADLGRFIGRPTASTPAVDHEDPAMVSDRLTALQENPHSFPTLDARSGSPRQTGRLPPVRTSPYEDDEARRRHRIGRGWELATLTRRDFLGRDILHPLEFGMPFSPSQETCTSVMSGLRVLCGPEMYADTTRAIHQLLGHTGQRFNYNSLAYDFMDSGALEIRRTIEFREAVGSVDPSWVAAWAKICSRIVEFCLEAEEDVFVELLMSVVEAELSFEATGDSRYDVVDLVNDLGLHNEAELVEKILTGDRDSFWFPCALEESSADDSSAASIMVPPES